MSEAALSYSGGAAFATARRGGIDDYELEFIRQRRRNGVSVQNISRMLGRHQADVAMVVDAACFPAPVKGAVEAPPVDLAMTKIARRHASAWGISLDDIRGFGRSRSISYPRCAAVLEMSRYTFPYAEIAAYFHRSTQVIQYMVSHAKGLEEAGKLNAMPRPPVSPARPPIPSMESIIQATAALYGISEHDLRHPANRRDVSPLQHAMWALRQIPGEPGRPPHYSLKVIGFELGGRDHTTIMFGIQAHEKRIAAQAKAVAA